MGSFGEVFNLANFSKVDKSKNANLYDAKHSDCQILFLQILNESCFVKLMLTKVICYTVVSYKNNFLVELYNIVPMRFL